MSDDEKKSIYLELFLKERKQKEDKGEEFYFDENEMAAIEEYDLWLLENGYFRE